MQLDASYCDKHRKLLPRLPRSSFGPWKTHLLHLPVAFVLTMSECQPLLHLFLRLLLLRCLVFSSFSSLSFFDFLEPPPLRIVIFFA